MSMPTRESRPNSELLATLDNLYRVTERYEPLLRNLEDRDLRVQLTRVSRRSVHQEPIGRYAAEAVLIVGDSADYRYFLPRILELLAGGWDTPIVGAETLIGRLHFAEWMLWPRQERLAVQQVLSALWRSVLATYPTTHTADSMLCGLGWAEDDLGPYLATWAQSPQPQAALHLSDFLEANIQSLSTSRKLSNQFWTSDRKTQRGQVIGWIKGGEALETLQNGLDRAQKGDAATSVQNALDRLVALTVTTRRL